MNLRELIDAVCEEGYSLQVHEALQRRGAGVHRGRCVRDHYSADDRLYDEGRAGDFTCDKWTSGQADAPAVMIKLDAQRLTELLTYCQEPKTRTELQEFCGIHSREYFTNNILNPLLETGRLLRTIPDKPKSPNQKYYWNK